MSEEVPETAEEIKQIERDLMTEIKTEVADFGPTLIKNKLELNNVLMQSAALNGPTDQHSSYQLLLEKANMGMRELSRRTNMSRKKLLSMIEGRIDMPIEAQTAIIDAIEQKCPDMMKRLEQMADEYIAGTRH